MSTTVTVTNWRRSRKFGWSYSTTPTGRGIEIERPEHPMYTGTIRQLLAVRAADRTFQSLFSGGTFYTTAWFYDGRRILGARYWCDTLGFYTWMSWSAIDKPYSVTLEVEDDE